MDSWIDVINANINGGVRTAFKSSRLKFGGSNVDVQRSGTSTSLPLQMPEPSLMTANTVIDFAQGAITASTEHSHLAIQGEGFYLVLSPDAIDTTAGANFGTTKPSPNAKFYVTRDGEFHTDANGLLVTSYGYYLVTLWGIPPSYGNAAGLTGLNTGVRAVFNNLDSTTVPPTSTSKLSDYLNDISFFTGVGGPGTASIIKVDNGKQQLKYSQYGSTVYDFGWFTTAAAPTAAQVSPGIQLSWHANDGTSCTILSKSLEASNASMTQSVPELSLAQKLFSALTKVMQIHQTNTDSVLNLIR